MAFTVSPNMNLIIPGVGTEAGPTYAQDVNSSLSLIDGHDHSAGSGVQITPSGLNINSDLAINGNNLTLVRTLRFQPQVSDPALASDLGVLYEVGVDLYYRDGAGNAIRITQGGSVTGSTGTITGLPSGTASASYSAGTFTFQAATLTPANIDAGSYTLRNNVASSFGLTLAPPNAMVSNYSLTLPNLPGSTSFVTLDNAGNFGATIPTFAGITTSMIADQSITPVKLAQVVLAISGSSGAFGTTSASFVDVPNSSITPSVSNSLSPVRVTLVSDNSGQPSFLRAQSGSSQLRIVDAAGAIEFGRIAVSFGDIPPAFEIFDTLPALGRTYKLQIKVLSGGGGVFFCRLIGYEI